MSDFFAFAERYFPYILKGAIVTIELTALSLLISIALGLIAAIGKLSGRASRRPSPPTSTSS